MTYVTTVTVTMDIPLGCLSAISSFDIGYVAGRGLIGPVCNETERGGAEGVPVPLGIRGRLVEGG